MIFTRVACVLLLLIVSACADTGEDGGTNTTLQATPTIVTADLSATELLLDYNENVQATGGTNAGYQWSITNGVLPPGIVLSGGTPKATLKGTPTQLGKFPFTLQVDDSEGGRDVRDFVIEVRAATVAFEYELWMQAQTSLDPGSIAIQGKVVNTGGVPLDLTPQTISFLGLPGNGITNVCDNICIQQQMAGLTLAPGETFSFTWITATITSNLDSWAGNLFSASVGLVPLGSDWKWIAAGNLPEILVSSEFVNGPANTALAFNKRIINLATAHEFITTPSPLE